MRIRRVFIWSLSKSPKTKNHANAKATYIGGIGANPGIPVIELIDEINMSAITATKSGRLGFDFQKFPFPRTTKIVNNPPNSNISNEKVFNTAVL